MKFSTIAELILLCRDMKPGDYRYYEFVGTDFPDANQVQYALNSQLPQEVGIYFECVYLKPPELAIRRTNAPGSFRRFTL